MASGFFVTALVQSSSAITVATIGFVNAGLLNLGQAVAVTYGSNIGTTATGWLVAAIGFHVNVRAFALPLVGIGMAMRLLFGRGRLGPLGEALAGFGVFFLGIDVLRAGFEGLGSQLELSAVAGTGPGRALLLVAVGFGLTLLMQSSSAAIAIILTAVGGGVVTLASGAALVIGANVGTTSTAALAVIGATPNAKRVAAAHVAFNFITGILALLLLPFLLYAIIRARSYFDLDAQPATVLAGFHTIFNLMGVAVMWPLTNRLLRFLERRFRTQEEDEAQPQYLDRHVLATPDLAWNAIFMELARCGKLTRRIACAALDHDPRAALCVEPGRQSIDLLIPAIGEYVQQLPRPGLPPALDELMPTALRVLRYYSEAAELAGSIAAGRAVLDSPVLDARARTFVEEVREFIAVTGVDDETYSAEAGEAAIAGIVSGYQILKAELLETGSHTRVSVEDVVQLLDWLSDVRRCAEQIEKGTRHLTALELVDDDDEDEEPAQDAAQGADLAGSGTRRATCWLDRFGFDDDALDAPWIGLDDDAPTTRREWASMNTL